MLAPRKLLAPIGRGTWSTPEWWLEFGGRGSETLWSVSQRWAENLTLDVSPEDCPLDLGEGGGGLDRGEKMIKGAERRTRWLYWGAGS